MNRNMKQNEWVDAVMGSTKGMQRADANPYLYSKIITRLKEENKPVFEVRGLVVRRFAIAASIMIAVNIFSVVHLVSNSSNGAKEQGYSALSSELGLTNTYNY